MLVMLPASPSIAVIPIAKGTILRLYTAIYATSLHLTATICQQITQLFTIRSSQSNNCRLQTALAEPSAMTMIRIEL